MGTNKALLKIDGGAIIARSYQILARLFHEVIIVTNTPEDYAFLPCRKVPDIHPELGSIAGLHSAVVHGSNERTFVAACDMPCLSAGLIRHLCSADISADAAVPLNQDNLREPLHAVYARSILPAMQTAIDTGDMSILHLLDKVGTRIIDQETVGSIPGGLESFRNVNTPEEYERLTSTH